jgi:hypothetical protein
MRTVHRGLPGFAVPRFLQGSTYETLPRSLMPALPPISVPTRDAAGRWSINRPRLALRFSLSADATMTKARERRQ